MRKAILGLLVVLCSLGVCGQERTGNKQRIQYIEVPQGQILVVLLQQPESPLKIEEAKCLFRIDTDKTIIGYKVRNVSSKPIATFTVTAWDSGGAGGTLPVLMADSSRPLLPGAVLSSLDENTEIHPLTRELHEKLKQDRGPLFEGRMRQIYFLLVDQVHFVDGTTFNDKRVSKALSDYLFNRGSYSDQQ